MPKTLERPKTHRSLEQPARCRTPFLERNGDNRHCLGNPRWGSPPSIPSRQRAQEVVDDIERVRAESVLSEYRRMSEHKALHDIQARREAIERLEVGKDFAGAEIVRRQVSSCNHQEFLVAQAALQELEVSAGELVVPILERLIESFDAELNEYAAKREADLERFGIPLNRDESIVEWSSLSSTGNAVINGEQRLVWTLWSDLPATNLHSNREVVRNLRQKFDHFGNYSKTEINSMYAINSLRFLATNDDCSFSWL
jgi:hypothetical protein